MRPQWMAAVIIGMTLFAVVPADAAVHVLNGSFEDGATATDPFTTLNATSTAITGWTVTSGSIDWIFTYWQPSEGSRSLDLSGNQMGTIVSQKLVDIQQNQRYLLEFDMAGNPDGAPVVKTLEVSVGDQTDVVFTFDATGKTKTNMGWKTMSLVFTAIAAETNLQFVDTSVITGNTPYGVALDNVRVSEYNSSLPVPEPGTLAIWSVLGAAGAGLAAGRRRAQGWTASQRLAIHGVIERHHR